MVKEVKPRRAKHSGWESRWTGLWFVLPFVAGLGLLFLLPIAAVPVISLSHWSLLSSPRWAGLDNYAHLLHDPQFLRSAWITALFVAGLVPLNIALAMGLALLLNVRVGGVGFFRMLLFSPVVVPAVAWALVWRFALQPDFGLVNNLLAKVGLVGPNWLLQFPWALVAVVVSLLIEHLGLNMLIFLGAIQAIPKELLEAAAIDGANPRQIFWKITLPILSPTLFLVMVVTTIGALKVFAPIYVLTSGTDSAEVLMIQMWRQGFKYFELGYASAIAWVLFLAMLALTLVQWGLRRRWVFNEA
ncbi:MAG: sugar ABC transporter permease [Thermaceae bacterium]|nr:sugar ABC transporter permease [Thermaceae bacterium]